MFIGLILIIQCIYVAHTSAIEKVVFNLKAGQSRQVSHNSRNSQLHIFCHDGIPKTGFCLWTSIIFTTSISDLDGVEFFYGKNTTDVESQFTNKHGWFSWLSLLPNAAALSIQSPTVANINPFEKICIGIKTPPDHASYQVQLILRRFDFWRVLLLFVGLFLFFTAYDISRKTAFFYCSGVSIGILASLLVLVFFIGRFLPRKSAASLFVLAGWSLVVAGMRYLFLRLQNYLVEYKNYLLAYVVITGMISFAICYLWGPISNPRSLNLLQWSLQVLSTIVIYFHSHHEEASVAIIVTMLTIYFFPTSWIRLIERKWLIWFPKPRVLLTEEEYQEQGYIETQRNLGDLRSFCVSPDCRSWSLVNRLKDPKRFAEFVQGGSHLQDEEVLAYETEPHDHLLYKNREEDDMITDDSDSD